MVRPKIMAAVLVAAFIVAATGTAVARPLESESSVEIAAVLAAKVSPMRAVEIAEKHTNARAVEVFARQERSRIAYAVKLVDGEVLRKVQIDLDTGKVLENREIVSLPVLMRSHQTELQELATAKTRLAQAIAVAIANADGRAIEAGYKTHAGKLSYDVLIDKAGKTEKHFIDAATGREIVSATSSAAAERTGEEGSATDGGRRP